MLGLNFDVGNWARDKVADWAYDFRCRRLVLREMAVFQIGLAKRLRFELKAIGLDRKQIGSHLGWTWSNPVPFISSQSTDS